MKRLALLLVATTTLIVACGGNTASLAAPSPALPDPTAPVTATPTAVVVSGPATMSGSVQLTATARFSDNTVRDVTAVSVWESSNPAFATVSPAGVVTVVGSGDVDVRATYQNIVGSIRLKASPPVNPSTFVLTGVVREAAPAERPLSGVRVQVTAGREFGMYTFTDDQGAFKLPAVSAGRMFLEFTRPGYELSTVDLTITGPAQRDAWLYPMPPSDASGATAIARCEDGTWSWSTDPNAACRNNGGVAYFVCPGPFCDNP